MGEGDDSGEEAGRKPAKPGLAERFREAWAWYREDLKTTGFNAGTPQEQTGRVNAAGVVFGALLTAMAVFKGASAPVVMIFAMSALIIFARGRKARGAEARLRYGRLETFAEAVFLFFLLILLAEDVLPKLF